MRSAITVLITNRNSYTTILLVQRFTALHPLCYYENT